LKKGAFRQFFRLVTSQVSLWYADHSTPNPLGVKPDPAITRIVVGDKFSEDGVELLDPPDNFSGSLKSDAAEEASKQREEESSKDEE